MKTFRLAALLILLYSCPAFSKGPKPATEGSRVTVISLKKEAFCFKVSNEFMGASVEVFNKEGKLIYKEKVSKKKTTLNFDQLDASIYLIRIKKGDLIEQFECTFNVR